MHTFYQFITGPLVWISFSVFIAGSLFKLSQLFFLAYQKERFIFNYMSLKYGLRSILHWLTPFGTVNMRLNPVMTIVTFAFHLSLFIAPFFLSAHVIMWDEAWDFGWWVLPNPVADLLTIIIIIACGYFLARRILRPEVRFVTTPSDFGLLLVVVLPFVSGFWAYHQLPWGEYATLIHIVSGNLMLMVIPFTRLTHMLFSLFTRAYMGSEFGAVRHAKDW